MTTGNEKKYKKVIDFVPVVREWVEFGWIDVGQPIAGDFSRYHVVRGDFTK